MFEDENSTDPSSYIPVAPEPDLLETDPSEEEMQSRLNNILYNLNSVHPNDLDTIVNPVDPALSWKSRSKS